MAGDLSASRLFKRQAPFRGHFLSGGQYSVDGRLLYADRIRESLLATKKLFRAPKGIDSDFAHNYDFAHTRIA
jgi:hypothetical protein